jgi:hypothetical protein
MFTMFMMKKPGEDIYRLRSIDEAIPGTEILLNDPRRSIIESECEVVKEQKLLEGE